MQLVEVVLAISSTVSMLTPIFHLEGRIGYAFAVSQIADAADFVPAKAAEVTPPVEVTVENILSHPKDQEGRKLALIGYIRNLGDNLQARKGRKIVFTDMRDMSISALVSLPFEVQGHTSQERPQVLGDVLDTQVRVVGSIRYIDGIVTLLIESVSYYQIESK